MWKLAHMTLNASYIVVYVNTPCIVRYKTAVEFNVLYKFCGILRVVVSSRK